MGQAIWSSDPLQGRRSAGHEVPGRARATWRDGGSRGDYRWLWAHDPSRSQWLYRREPPQWFPAAVGNVVRYVHGATGKPILVTENGIDTSEDAERARFIPSAVKSVLEARDGGVPVLGYIHWSLLDNFEWLSGYGPKYGLVAVDRQTFKRTVKPSAELFGRIARAGGVA